MKTNFFGLLTLTALVAMSCASARGPMAMATVQPIGSSLPRGTVHFQDTPDGVEVQIDLTGVPQGAHGFHLHETGDCGSGGSAAGAHFNPMNMPHAGPDAVSHHAGDLGNISAGPDGEVHTRFTTRSITVREGPTSVIGRAVILHVNRDDLTTQPSGNAGNPIACGVVEPMAGSMHR
jgi:Cu-Zn family superoxide dismutase